MDGTECDHIEKYANEKSPHTEIYCVWAFAIAIPLFLYAISGVDKGFHIRKDHLKKCFGI